MNLIKKSILKKWYLYAIAICFMLISISLDMLSPMITKHLIDDVIVGKNMEIFTPLILCILFIGIGRCFFGYFKETLFDYASVSIACTIRRALFTHIQKLSANFFDDNNTGELMARVKDDVDRIWNSVGFVGMLIIEVFFHTTIVLFCMYRISPTLAIFPSIVIPLVGGLAIVMERKLGRIYEEISEETASLNTVAEENLSGVRTVKAFAREKYEIGKFLSHNKRYYDLNMQQSKVFVRYYPLFQLITKIIPFITLIIGGSFVISKELTIGELGAFTEYSMNIIWPMEMLGWLTNELSSGLASRKKIYKIFKHQPTITESDQAITIDRADGKIQFDHVSFSSEGKEILSDITFTVESGHTLGIMGATGAGKTSIIHLLNRLYDASEGAISLDNQDIKELSLGSLRKQISVVMQDVFLFSDTVNENIKLGQKSQLSEESVTAAAIQAKADTFIDDMDEKYETIIGERGVGLSGGQKQRISIARALAKHTPIVVLDDSTSALDMETERYIQHSLLELNDTTKIIIAHRISAVRHANEIIYLVDGKIAERGTHEELLQKKGYYYQTYQAQYGRKEVSTCQ